MRILLSSCVALLLAACASLQDAAQKTFDDPGLAGTRWGLVVMTMDGRELVAIRPDERFTPASNTKLFTIAAAFHRLGDLSIADPAMGASVRLVPHDDGSPPDIILVGGGDAMLIDADDCERDCLSSLADMVVANGVMKVGKVAGDDQLFPDERWGPGWSQDDLAFRSGAPASALTVNSNEVALEVSPGASPNETVTAKWRGRDNFYYILNNAYTSTGDADELRIARQPGDTSVSLYGLLGAQARPRTIPLTVDDPARYAAWRFVRLLKERGVSFGDGGIFEYSGGAHHRDLALTDEPAHRGEPFVPPDPPSQEIARLLPPPLIEDVRFLMKQSQNLHAELLLRRLGLIEGHGSRADGLAIVEAMLAEAGADRAAWDFSDGSGMSVYNRVTPRMVARFLRWTTSQPWGAAYRDTLPIGGVDGTLSRRFKDTPLEGRIFAKTGTLANVTALSGFMLTSKGNTLVFSAYANDRPSGAGLGTAALDAALNLVAAAN